MIDGPGENFQASGILFPQNQIFFSDGGTGVTVCRERSEPDFTASVRGDSSLSSSARAHVAVCVVQILDIFVKWVNKAFPEAAEQSRSGQLMAAGVECLASFNTSAETVPLSAVAGWLVSIKDTRGWADAESMSFGSRLRVQTSALCSVAETRTCVVSCELVEAEVAPESAHPSLGKVNCDHLVCTS